MPGLDEPEVAEELMEVEDGLEPLDEAEPEFFEAVEPEDELEPEQPELGEAEVEELEAEALDEFEDAQEFAARHGQQIRRVREGRPQRSPLSKGDVCVFFGWGQCSGRMLG